jgi:hypothetical protein
MKGLALIGVSALLLFTPALPAQNKPGSQGKVDESFFTILEQALNINIAARISEAGEPAVWNVESTEITIPGRSVSVKLVGSNIVVVAQFTPYIGENDTLILVAQGQVWISSPMEEKIKYLTTLKSIPVNLGETVFFFPLGVKNVEQQAKNVYNIELEIKVLPHSRQADPVSK